MATIKAIEAKSVHQIQSGQVIVDLCSVVKELVENSLDAGATSVEVRFKNNGLDSIEVQDNGSGIDPANYPNIALKHYTSKLSNYNDLSTLRTFGFRGEALSSLAALSQLSVVTATATEVPKGTRLEFERSGALKDKSTAACQRGSLVVVEDIFDSLPVRRKELSKNIKREYGKVLGLLHAYACICVNVKFNVKNSMPKSKSVVVFSTKENKTTRENIANVYGAKTLSALVALELDLDFEPAPKLSHDDAHNTNLIVRGHISKPVFGEGRQTPDRQMFFVNGRPCGLPQIAKAINEVYRSFNMSQSPFIFVDFIMDTSAYDVNVSPDKRTILLHNSASLIENLKTRLTELFDKQEQTIPQSRIQTAKLPSFRPLTLQKNDSAEIPTSEVSRRPSITPEGSKYRDKSVSVDCVASEADETPKRFLHDHFRSTASSREDPGEEVEMKIGSKLDGSHVKQSEENAALIPRRAEKVIGINECDDEQELNGQNDETRRSQYEQLDPHVRDFNARLAEQNQKLTVPPSDDGVSVTEEPLIPTIIRENSKDPPGIVQNAFGRIRLNKARAEIATITVGDETFTRLIGSQLPKGPLKSDDGIRNSSAKESRRKHAEATQAIKFSKGLRKFGAQATESSEESSGSEVEDGASDSENRDNNDVEKESEEEAEIYDNISQELQDDRAADSDVETSHEDQDQDSDEDYLEEEDKKAAEDARVAELIRAAEESAAMPTKESLRRAGKAMKGGQTKDSTSNLLVVVESSFEDVQGQMEQLRFARQPFRVSGHAEVEDSVARLDEETRLSLTVSKEDFANMAIIGQFNLGFILAVRPAVDKDGDEGKLTSARDELFIIDQHASDEKFNFERLQAGTVVGNQRMVRPVTLDLTAVEEEIVLENNNALEKNGFIVEVDTSGEAPVGRRCKLVSLPLSKEVVFDTRDFDELVHLLAESPALGTASAVPRSSKVRKMFAMRACRSSIMIGKTLSKKQMSLVVAHMGAIDKPWNCPHGRPTMRHLTSLDALETWQEGDGLVDETERQAGHGDRWRQYIES